MPWGGLAGFLLDGLYGYAGLRKAFIVTCKGEEKGIARFTLTPRPDGLFPKGNRTPTFELGVDAATGLAVELKVQTAENDGERATSLVTVVRVEIDPVIRDAFLLPQDVRAAGVVDSATGKPVKIPNDE